jgi:hypothetical protein
MVKKKTKTTVGLGISLPPHYTFGIFKHFFSVKVAFA